MDERIKSIEKLLIELIEKLHFPQKEVLDIDDAARLTSLKKSYIYKLNHEGKIPCYSYSDNGKLYFKKTELEEWMTKNKRFYKEDFNTELLLAS